MFTGRESVLHMSWEAYVVPVICVRHDVCRFANYTPDVCMSRMAASRPVAETRAVALRRLQKYRTEQFRYVTPTELASRVGAREGAYNEDFDVCDRQVCSEKLTVAARAGESNDTSEWRRLLSRHVALSPIIIIAGISAPAVTSPLSSYINPVPDCLTLDSWISDSAVGDRAAAR